MPFLVVNFICLFVFALADHVKNDRNALVVVLVFAAAWLAILPALQYGVGADYFSYRKIYEGEKSLEVFWGNREFFFYYLVKLLRFFGLPAQSLFVSVSFLSSLLLVNSFRILWEKGFNLASLFFLVFVATGMLHNQLNGIRNYIAVYLFLNAVLYKADGKDFKSYFLYGFSVLWHQSAVFLMPLILVPRSFYMSLYKYLAPVLVAVVFISLSGVLLFFLEYMVEEFFSFYSHYLERQNKVPIVNYLTKLYYVPIYLVFLYLLWKGRVTLNEFERVLVVFWVLALGVALSLIYSGLFFRAYHYLVFFTVIPMYFVMRRCERDIHLFLLLVSYLLLPYLLKVTVFATGEYKYVSILGGPVI